MQTRQISQLNATLSLLVVAVIVLLLVVVLSVRLVVLLAALVVLVVALGLIRARRLQMSTFCSCLSRPAPTRRPLGTL